MVFVVVLYRSNGLHGSFYSPVTSNIIQTLAKQSISRQVIRTSARTINEYGDKKATRKAGINLLHEHGVVVTMTLHTVYFVQKQQQQRSTSSSSNCLLYTSDAADE